MDLSAHSAREIVTRPRRTRWISGRLHRSLHSAATLSSRIEQEHSGRPRRIRIRGQPNCVHGVLWASAKNMKANRIWTPERPHTLVVACSDGRLQEQTDDFLHK